MKLYKITFIHTGKVAFCPTATDALAIAHASGVVPTTIETPRGREEMAKWLNGLSQEAFRAGEQFAGQKEPAK